VPSEYGDNEFPIAAYYVTKRESWISPAFDGHLTFLKISRIRGTQIAKPMIEAKAESE